MASKPPVNKRTNNRDALLSLLEDGQQHHMSECQRTAGYRYGARLFELRKQGYDIETIRMGDDEFAYRMLKGQLALI